jgi:hypothetical protein
LDNKIPFIVSFSGNGFHFHLLLKPAERSLDTWLSHAVKAIQYQFKQQLNLQTLNTQCAEPKRLVRVPFSRYVCKASGSNQWSVNKNYCIPLKLNQLMNMKTEEIIQLSLHPTYESGYLNPGDKITLKHLLKDENIDSRTFNGIPLNGISENVNCTSYEGQDMFEIVKLLMPLPCLYKAVWEKNPPHIIRFSACAFLTSVLSREEAQQFFDKLAHEAEWNDRANKAYRTYQIDNIYNMNYRPHSCEELMRMGYCSGKDCFKYNDKIAEIKIRNNMIDELNKLEAQDKVKIIK